MSPLIRHLLADSVNRAMGVRAVARDLQRQADNSIPGQMIFDGSEQLLRNLEHLEAILKDENPGTEE